VCFVTLLCTERQTFFLVPALTLKGAKIDFEAFPDETTATERSGNESGVLREHFVGGFRGGFRLLVVVVATVVVVVVWGVGWVQRHCTQMSTTQVERM
jgi:hypothetical protein